MEDQGLYTESSDASLGSVIFVVTPGTPLRTLLYNRGSDQSYLNARHLVSQHLYDLTGPLLIFSNVLVINGIILQIVKIE